VAESNSTVEISKDDTGTCVCDMGLEVWTEGSDKTMKPTLIPGRGIHTRCLHLALEPCTDEAIVPPDRAFNRTLI